MARPRKQIDPAQVEALAGIGCTVDEIAAVLDCSARILQKRFFTHMDRGRCKMRMSLRRLQMRAAENGNAALLIWLGKQNLGQRDKQDVDVRVSDYREAVQTAVAGIVATGASEQEAIELLKSDPQLAQIIEQGLASEKVQ